MLKDDGRLGSVEAEKPHIAASSDVQDSLSLFSLGEIAVAGTVHFHRHAGTRTVSICRIRGSESRAGDFDCDFNPLHDHNRGHWLSVATARQRGKTLPPVALIQVGDLFFVRDGHHRISVARTLGQSAIEATVEVCQFLSTYRMALKIERWSKAAVSR